MPVFEGKVATLSFIISALYLITSVPYIHVSVVAVIEVAYIAILVVFFWTKPVGRIVLISHVLGGVFSCGVLVGGSSEHYRFFGVYLMVLSFFHVSEYVATATYNPKTLSLDSFLINHSREYTIAAVASWLEYTLEYAFFPSIKSVSWICWVGIVMAVAGEATRKISMLTAMTNFTHIVSFRKHDDHKLVTHGIYAWFRHPSYVGWFYWSIGTQLILCNPVCAVLYAIAAWLFFKDRIEDEEEMLLQFFGNEYLDYSRRVPTGLPFIKGYSGNAEELIAMSNGVS